MVGHHLGIIFYYVGTYQITKIDFKFLERFILILGTGVTKFVVKSTWDQWCGVSFKIVYKQ